MTYFWNIASNLPFLLEGMTGRSSGSHQLSVRYKKSRSDKEKHEKEEIEEIGTALYSNREKKIMRGTEISVWKILRRSFMMMCLPARLVNRN